MSHIKTLVFSLIFCWLWVGCATPQHENLKKVRVGMEKVDVLDILGSPNHSRFNDGHYEWIYIYYVNEKRLAKQMVFKKTKLIKIADYDLDGTLKDAIERSDSIKEMEREVEQRRRENESGFEELDD